MHGIIFVGISDALPMIRRRKSETFRAQYINSKEIRYFSCFVDAVQC